MTLILEPLPGRKHGDKYGPRGVVAGVGNMGFHTGLDIPAPEGEPILSAAAGTVKRKWWDAQNGVGMGGHMVSIDHGYGVETRYAHMQHESWRRVGERVTEESFIGHVGSTGAANGAHLHLELYINGRHVDPAKYLIGRDEKVTNEDIKKIVKALLDEPVRRSGVDKHGKPRVGNLTLRQLISTYEHQVGLTRRIVEDIKRKLGA